MKLTKSYMQPHLKHSQKGSVYLLLLVGVVIVFGLIVIFRVAANHAAAASPKIASGVSGFCLNDSKDSEPSSSINIWKCNNSTTQSWSISGVNITHGSDYCLAVADNSQTVGANINLSHCNADPGQVWLRDNGGYFNPNSGMCLATPSDKSGSNLVISTCNNLSIPEETWTPQSASGNLTSSNPNCQGNEGAKVACYAEYQWTQWQKTGSNHENLLNSYTDGAAYEEWCADFVSYIYKEAGYPFSGGETDGWDENIASNIQYMGFQIHSVDSGYVPKPGDVAYFNYPGGHVELVVSGGEKPTYIYGNSATIDPSTGNGEMMANTISSEPNLGKVIYYLSPN